jgi:plasmid stability protein
VANLTISLDETVVRQARIRAISEGTSVSAQVREFLAQYAAGTRQQSVAGTAFLAAARASVANADGAQWQRADAYDRPYPSAAANAPSP